MPGAGGPGGDMGGGGERVLQLLAGLQQQPSPSAEESMLFEATVMINGAYAKVASRNAKVGQALMKANQEVNRALELLKQEGQGAMNKPPDLGMPGTAQPAVASPTGGSVFGG